MKKLVVLLFMFVLTMNVIAKNAEAQVKYVAVGEIPEDVIQHVEQVISEHKDEMVARYEVKEMPLVTIKIWSDRKSFEESYGENAEYVHGYVVQDLWEARFFNGRPQLGYGVLHEYVHLVHLALNPSFNNNPRWLWEAVAVYESGRPPIQKLADLKCFAKEKYPTIEELDTHPFNIYRVGFYLTDYIVKTWGQESLTQLIKSNGNINKTLDISIKEFEKNWIDFLKNKHGLVPKHIAEDSC